jgi:hypothetical protein
MARQTGMDCSGCHVGGFGPQLTPAGMRFKIGGYTETDDKEGKIPVSGMVTGSFTRTNKDQDPAPGVKANNNLKFDGASLFYAGRIANSFGAFAELEYDGVAKQAALGGVDFRFAHVVKMGEREATVGVSINNTPTMHDPFNTLPAWGFPFVSSPVAAGTGEAASFLNGGLSGRVLGATGYINYGNLYGELGSYGSLSPSVQSKLGQGRDYQRMKFGDNAYWRMAWMQDLKTHAYHVGVFGMSANVQPDRTVASPKDRYRDIGVDAGYQFLGTREHVVSVSGSHVRERLTDAESVRSTLRETRLNASYYYRQTWGGSLGYFSTTGSDPTAATSGQILQFDWTPWGKESAPQPSGFGWANLRLGFQYWNYNKFAGASAGAKDHNTAYLFGVLAF